MSPTAHDLELQRTEDRLLARWIDSYSPATRRIYQHAVDDLRAFCGNLLCQITPADLCAWRDAQLTSGRSATRVAQLLSAVSSAYRFLNEATFTANDGFVVNHNPVDWIERPAVERKNLPRHLTVEQARALLDAISVDTARGVQHMALILTGLFTGLSSGELCALRYEPSQEDNV